MRIGVIVDSPDRDIDGCVAICSSVAAIGHTAYLIPMYYQGFEVPRLDLDLLIANYCRKANQDMLRAFHGLGTKIVVLDQEGSVWESIDQYCHSYPKDAGDYLEAIFTWGQNQEMALKNYFGKSKVAIVTTGHPRLDFLDARFKVDKYESELLVVGSFGLGFPRHASPKQELKNMLKTGYSKSYAIPRMREDIVMRDNLFSLIGRLALGFPQVKIIVRPHPFEQISAYFHELQEKYDNVFVEPYEPIYRWLSGCKFLLHITSSAAIDAAIAGKTVLQLRWLLEPLASKTGLPSSVGLSMESESDLFAFLQGAPDSHVVGEEFSSALEQLRGSFNNISEAALPLLEKEVKKVVLSLEGSPNHRPFLNKFKLCLCLSRTPSLRNIIDGFAFLVFGSRIWGFTRSHYLTLSRYKRDKWLDLGKILDSFGFVGQSQSRFSNDSNIVIMRDGCSYMFRKQNEKVG